MTHTIDEAGKLWCCSHKEEKCVANSCMAWRWSNRAMQLFVESSHLSREMGIENLTPKPIEREGYCGLAGRPE